LSSKIIRDGVITDVEFAKDDVIIIPGASKVTLIAPEHIDNLKKELSLVDDKEDIKTAKFCAALGVTEK
jgi:hypothetical protein